MPLFGSRTPPSVGELVARKRYHEAIEMLHAQLAVERNSTKLRMQLADLLVLAGRQDEAVPVLIRLADDSAAEGSFARAMALLKKVQRIAPDRSDVESRLAMALHPAAARSATGEHYEPHAKADLAAQPVVRVPDAFAPPAPPPPAPPPPAVLPPAVPPPSDDEERAATAQMRAELLDTIHDVLITPTAPPKKAKAVAPLFSSLTDPEMLALFRGLRLLSFEPGDLIIHQGDEGDRMFVITSGRAKIFLKEPGGRRRILVRTAEEGEFFGEMSLLKPEPRQETVVAASNLELLELERTMLEQVCQTYPRVRAVLEDFSQERLLEQQKILALRPRHGTAGPAAE